MAQKPFSDRGKNPREHLGRSTQEPCAGSRCPGAPSGHGEPAGRVGTGSAPFPEPHGAQSQQPEGIIASDK